MKKINIAELLKDCPKGMELDCTIYDNVTFERFDVEQNRCYFKAGPADTFWTTCYGKINDSPFGKCVIFPKGKTTWEGFVPSCEFKDGDIVATTNGLWIGITTGGKSGESIPTYCVTTSAGGFEAYFNYREKWKFQRLATTWEKEKLFKAIKDNGYKWNEETKTLEKLAEPKFKDGDRVVKKGDISTPVSIVRVGDKYYYHYSNTEGTIGLLPIAEQDDWELVQNKFDITTLKPFDKVLVRDNNSQKWTADLFSFCDRSLVYPYSCVGHYTNQCIPYIGNENLLGTTDDCDNFYKTWE